MTITEQVPEKLWAALAVLLQYMPEETLVQLASLVQDVSRDTRFGDVKVIIADGRVQILKAEKSYKPNKDTS